MPIARREKDIASPPAPRAWSVDEAPGDVVCKATDYPSDTVIAPHRHERHQLVYALHGLMVVRSGQGHWVVPSTRALWMPAGTVHSVRCVGTLGMRSLYIRPAAIAGMPAQPSVMAVEPLLEALIRSAAGVPWDYAAESRDGRLMRLILDELHALPALPLHLPQPHDARLLRIGAALDADPADTTTLHDWAARLEVNVKTIQRLCRRELQMSFGQWRQQLRLLRGLERLAAGDRIIDVAVELGYDSPSAFTAMFKRQFGQPPSQFFR
ncbi:helix-turn-helix transcriptional regulator [Xanthomonas sp. AM6]|uniref:AraC family transcriptional regulator n=1 Tax=Xanthomonas sp. AM6 TaxID=2982531 RepID=UPI0021DA62F2|nr:helix-turn-helix transcriptional regulator [Xanthomonas sp. AM6]UYB53378.1 helix-turn-helix transcriptional regulator [Xanthomonas sp. AM6]